MTILRESNLSESGLRESKARRYLPCFLPLVAFIALGAFGQNPDCSTDAVSTDDISVADGLQLPNYGTLWALDSWKGVKELVQLPRKDTAGKPLPLALHRGLDVDGEAAAIRLHGGNLQIFHKGFSGDDNGPVPSDFAIFPLTVAGNRRVASKAAVAALRAQQKGRHTVPAEAISMTQQRIGTTDWSRLWPDKPLAPGEYAIVRLLNAPQGGDEIHDFAIDPDAPENARPLRSEADRPSQ